MYKGQYISLVMPCRNEAEGLKQILPQVPKWVDEVLIIDNASVDATPLVARQYNCHYTKEPLIGYGIAYQTGFKQISQGIIIAMDGDGQYPIGEIEKLITPIVNQTADIVLGNRFPLKTPTTMPITRRVGNIILTRLMNVLFKTKLYDSQSGMWAFSAATWQTLHVQNNSMAFSQELKLRAFQQKLRLLEVHINYLPRTGQSKLHAWHGVSNLWWLIKEWLHK